MINDWSKNSGVHLFTLGWHITKITSKSFRKSISMVFRFNKVIHI